MTNDHIHGDMPVLRAGAELRDASAVMILLHGRGASARDILLLANEFERNDFAYIAPQASGSTWYPYSFLSPVEMNEPNLTSALQVVSDLITHLSDEGFQSENIVLGGFSQGACLATEYSARNPQRYGGIVGLSGGLIGPDGALRDYQGDFFSTPVFLGCSDVDFHIPKERVQETTRILSSMGAEVTERLYPGMGHTVNMDEIKAVKDMMSGIVS